MQLRENSNEIHMNCAHYSLKGWRSVSQFLLMGKPRFISKFEEFGEESSTDYWPGGDSLGCELLRGGYCSGPHWLVFRRPSVSPLPSRVITVSSSRAHFYFTDCGADEESVAWGSLQGISMVAGSKLSPHRPVFSRPHRDAQQSSLMGRGQLISNSLVSLSLSLATRGSLVPKVYGYVRSHGEGELNFPMGLSLLISHHELGLLFWIIPMVLIKFLKIPMRWGKLERRTREVNLRQTLILLVVKVEKGNWINVRASRSRREKRKCVFPQSLQNISVLPTPWFRLARPSMVSDLRVRR